MLEGEQAPAEIHLHSHHAIQLTFQLKGSFEIGIGNDRLMGPITAVASDVVHSFKASGAVAFLFIAPESLAGRAVQKSLLRDRTWAEQDAGLTSALEELRHCLLNGCDEGEMRELGRKTIEGLITSDTASLPDRRVMGMICHARRQLEDSVTLPAAAAAVNLSDGRARHLFVAQTGLPFKTYVLWLRIERAVELYASGSTLTEAAHEAGFADSAHFSRTFRRTFGLPAAALRLH